jgi:hypothetical protein
VGHNQRSGPQISHDLVSLNAIHEGDDTGPRLGRPDRVGLNALAFDQAGRLDRGFDCPTLTGLW